MYKIIYESSNKEFKILEIKKIKNSEWVKYESEETVAQVVDYLTTNKNAFLFQGTTDTPRYGEMVLTSKFKYVTGTWYSKKPTHFNI
jgi:hypothetical protein